MKCLHTDFTARHDGAIVCSRCFKPKSSIDRKVRRNETRDLTKPIEAALNGLPGVWASRNTNGYGHLPNGDPIEFGLGSGSPDIIGAVSCTLTYKSLAGVILNGPTFACFFALEVKWPDGEFKKSQIAWLHSVPRRVPGLFVDVVWSVDEALEAVERCRVGMPPLHLARVPGL